MQYFKDDPEEVAQLCLTMLSLYFNDILVLWHAPLSLSFIYSGYSTLLFAVISIHSTHPDEVGATTSPPPTLQLYMLHTVCTGNMLCVACYQYFRLLAYFSLFCPTI